MQFASGRTEREMRPTIATIFTGQQIKNHSLNHVPRYANRSQFRLQATRTADRTRNPVTDNRYVIVLHSSHSSHSIPIFWDKARKIFSNRLRVILDAFAPNM